MACELKRWEGADSFETGGGAVWEAWGYPQTRQAVKSAETVFDVGGEALASPGDASVSNTGHNDLVEGPFEAS